MQDYLMACAGKIQPQDSPGWNSWRCFQGVFENSTISGSLWCFDSLSANRTTERTEAFRAQQVDLEWTPI